MKVNGKKSLERFDVEFTADRNFHISFEVSAYDKEGLFEVLNEKIGYELSAIEEISIRKKKHNEK